jgi:hypothetical protein
MITIFLGIVFGAVGGVYIALGRKNHEPTYLVTGVLLLLYPYFFSSALAIVAIGIALSAVPIAQARGWW